MQPYNYNTKYNMNRSDMEAILCDIFPMKLHAFHCLPPTSPVAYKIRYYDNETFKENGQNVYPE